jgi:hypothetical protein
MPQVFEEDEKWEVRTQDKTYMLTGKQAEVLKTATSQGLRGLIWFKDFAISIPHITSVEKTTRSQKEIDLKREEFLRPFSKVDPTLEAML